MVFGRNDTQDARGEGGASVATGLPLHQDELDVVLDDGVRLVGLAQKAAAFTLGFVRRIGNFVPDDRCEIVEAETAAVLLNRCVERNDGVSAAVLPPRQAHVANNDDQATAGNEYAKTVAPHFIQFGKKLIVDRDVAELTVVLAVRLQRPIRRRREDEMDAAVSQGVKIAGIVAVEVMRRGNLTEQACNRTSQGRITCDAGQVCLMIGEWPETRGEELLQAVRCDDRRLPRHVHDRSIVGDSLNA